MIKKIIPICLLVMMLCSMSMANAMMPHRENPALYKYISSHKHDFVYQMNSYVGPGRFNITDIKSVKIEWTNEHETVIRAKIIACGFPGGNKVYLEDLGYTRYAYNHDEHNMYEEVVDEATGANSWKYLPPTIGGDTKLERIKESASASAEQVYYIATGRKFHPNSPYDYDYSHGVTNIFRS